MLGGEAGSELRAVAQTAAVSDVGPAESLLVEQVHEYARYGACTANGRKRDGSPACCVAAPGVAMSWSLNYRTLSRAETRRVSYNWLLLRSPAQSNGCPFRSANVGGPCG